MCDSCNTAQREAGVCQWCNVLSFHLSAGIMARPTIVPILLCCAVLAGDRRAAAHRALAEYAPVCPGAYTTTGECVEVYEDGMVFPKDGVYRRFDEPCKWTLSLVQVGRDAVGCIGTAKKCKIPKGIALCEVACTALKTIKNKLDTDADCKDDGKKNGSKSAFCFPGSALVRTRSGSQVPLRDVHPGQEIAAVRPDGIVEFSQVRLGGF